MTLNQRLTPYLNINSIVQYHDDNLPEAEIRNFSPGMIANCEYFNNPEWAKKYFQTCHRYHAFKDRWLAAEGSWDNKIVVDIGCGPGNLFCILGGKPKLLIGVDISKTSLLMAMTIGYTPIVADAHNLPFISAFADLVTLNATLHHCDDMAQVLAEAARLVKVGGSLILDHDPQLAGWNYKGIGMFFYKIRLPIYRYLFRNLHIPFEERMAMNATELHHKPGDGVTEELFRSTLEPMGFSVKVYPHNNNIGREALTGNPGSPPHWRYSLGLRLSGVNPKCSKTALSLMCVAQKVNGC